MTLGQSQWVGTDDDRVLSNADARIAGMGAWATNSADTHDIRLGLVWAGVTQLLTGTSGLTVNVAPHHFVASKDAPNGAYLGASRPGGPTPVTVPAAPSLGSKRVDVIWVRQKDKSAIVMSDSVTAAEYGVATGVPSSSPSKPLRGDLTAGFPADATEVGTVTWDSTSTVGAATNAAQCTLATTGLWTVTRGCPIPVRNATERDNTLTPYPGMTVSRLDNNCFERYSGTEWVQQVQGVWAAYNPFVTAAVNPTGITTTGLQCLTGKTVTFTFEARYGSGATGGSGTLSVSLPYAPSATGIFKGIGSASANGVDEYPIQLTTSAFYGASLVLSGPTSSGNSKLATIGGASFMGAAWANGGYVRGQITYQRA